MKKKQDSFVKIAITVLVVAMGIVGMAILYKATNTGSTELRSKAAEYKDVLVKVWEFKKGTEGWSGVGTIKVDQGDDALRGKLLKIYGKDGQIVNSAVNEKMTQGLKYIKFKLALRRPVIARATPDKPSCIQVMITCPNGKQQPAYTPDCRPNRCPTTTQPTPVYMGSSGRGEGREGGFVALEACPQDIKICPDGTQLSRINIGNGCQFAACPERRATPTPEVFNLVVQYMVDNQWASQTVKVVPNESYTEFSVQLPLKALTVQRIRFMVPVAAFQYTFWFDWVKLWSKVVILPTPTNMPTAKPTATPTPPCVPLPICVYVGVMDSRGNIIYCSPPPLTSGRVYCPKPTGTLTPTPPCLPLPSCVYVGSVDSRGSIVYCSPPPPPSGRVYCPKPTATVAPTPRTVGKCIVTGCNGELCVDENNPAKNTICVWREEYQCYRNANCARQASGACGWTQTSELTTCLNKYSYGGSSAPQSGGLQ